MLGTEVQLAVVVVVTEVPGLSLQDALAAASAVLESRFHPRSQHSPAQAVRRAVAARLSRFRLRFQSPSHIGLDPIRAVEIGGKHVH